VVVGALHGKGYRAGSYGSLLVASFDPATNKYYTLTKVGAGLSDKVLRGLSALLKPYVIRDRHRLVETRMAADVWFEPVKVVEVAGAELTVSPVIQSRTTWLEVEDSHCVFLDLFDFATIRRRNRRQV